MTRPRAWLRLHGGSHDKTESGFAPRHFSYKADILAALARIEETQNAILNSISANHGWLRIRLATIEEKIDKLLAPMDGEQIAGIAQDCLAAILDRNPAARAGADLGLKDAPKDQPDLVGQCPDCPRFAGATTCMCVPLGRVGG